MHQSLAAPALEVARPAPPSAWRRLDRASLAAHSYDRAAAHADALVSLLRLLPSLGFDGSLRNRRLLPRAGHRPLAPLRSRQRALRDGRLEGSLGMTTPIATRRGFGPAPVGYYRCMEATTVRAAATPSPDASKPPAPTSTRRSGRWGSRRSRIAARVAG